MWALWLKFSSLPVWQLALFSAVVAFIVHYLVSCWLLLRKSKRQSAPFDGPPANLLTGNLSEVTFDEKGLNFHLECTKKYGKVYKVWFGPLRSVICCSHPDTIKAVATTAAPKGMLVYGMMVPWLGWGLLVTHGPKWLRMRRLLTPAFHFDILRPYVNIFQKSAEQMLANWESVEGGHIELFHHVSLFTLDSIMKCALSYDSDCQALVKEGSDKRDPYIKAVFRLAQVIISRLMTPLYHSDRIFFSTPTGREFSRLCDLVHKKAEQIIQARRIALRNQKEQEEIRKKKYLDFLDILLEAKDSEGVGLTDEEIRAEVDTFMFEGHDTTASGITWSLYLLAKYPEHQKRCRDEVDELFRAKGNNVLDWDDLKSLEYLTLCIKESMRIIPPVPVVSRDLDTDLELDGKVAGKGAFVFIQIYVLHHNPTIWENPEVFDPQRFTRENSKNRSPHAYIPFSSGPRNCIGQNFAMAEIKTCLALILSKFELVFDDKHKPQLLAEMIMRSGNGVYIYVKPRNKTE